jgi:kynurenine formamidase
MFLRTCRSEIGVLIALGLTVTACGANAAAEPTLWNIQKVIASKKHVDLTRDFSPGIPRWPGFPDETRKYLYEQRKITASGHETTDTDPGIATTKDDYSLETYILSTNHYQIELLTNLDQVPEAGGIVVVSFPKPKNGSGFPARVFAIVP